MHSYRGSVVSLEALLKEWRHVYIGFSGLLTMMDEDVVALCKNCPLDRLLLETDGPYLPINGAPYSHSGQIPLVAAKAAEVKGCTVEMVMEAHRRNCYIMYG